MSHQKPLTRTPPNSRIDPQRSLTEHQLRIFRILETHSAGLAPYYLGALSALSTAENPDRFAQAAQSIRELLEKLPRRLDVVSKDSAKLKEQISNLGNLFRAAEKRAGGSTAISQKGGIVDAQLAKFLRKTAEFFFTFELEYPSRKEQYSKVIRARTSSLVPNTLLTGRTKAITFLWDFFIKASHHQLSDDELNEFESRLSAIEAFLVDIFEPETFDDFAEMDDLIHRSQTEAIEGSILQSAVKLISRSDANYGYFFEHLTSPDWLIPLRALGLFLNPPQTINSGSGTWSPVWPESAYLARVSAAAPDTAISIMLGMKETANSRVHDDLARAATAMAVSTAAVWSKREIPWINRQPRLDYPLPLSYGALAVHLSSNPSAPESLRLFAAVLRHCSTLSAGQTHEVWVFKELLEQHYPKLLKALGVPAFRILCDLSTQSLRRESYGEDEKSIYSDIWRPAIEPHHQNICSGDLPNVLIDVIRDSSKQLVEDGVAVADVLRVLQGRKSQLFKRIALNLLAHYPATTEASDYVTNYDNFRMPRLWHEYSKLLASAFPFLDIKFQATILKWISDGPDDGSRADIDASAERHRDAWRIRILSVISTHLPPEWQVTYARLIREIGKPENPDFFSYTTEWVGPTSPKSSTDLGTMSVEQFANYLREWEPSGKWNAAEPEGLARLITPVVAAEPSKFESALSIFENIDQTYARAIVEGISQAIEASYKPANWASILHFCYWIVSQPRGEEREVRRYDRDPHWGWARRSVASLLTKALRKSRVGVRYRSRVWLIISTMADDPDPSPEDNKNTSLDALNQAINSTRGELTRTAIEYGLWVMRAKNRGRSKGYLGFKTTPELGKFLADKLDAEREKSPAIRAIIGEYLPYVLLLDRRWMERRLGRIFSDKFPELRDATWDMYILYSRLFTDTFKSLRGQYNAAVNRITDESPKHYVERLGDHLFGAFGRGVIGWTANGMLRKYVAAASPEALARSVGSIGHAFDPKNIKVPANVVQRFQRLWQHLFEVVPHEKEFFKVFQAFGRWFSARLFDGHWCLEQLSLVIDITGGTDVDFLVVKRLSTLAKKYPRECFRILTKLARRTDTPWSILGWIEEGRAVLISLLSSGTTRDDAVKFIHELGTKGIYNFRDLVPAKSNKTRSLH